MTTDGTPGAQGRPENVTLRMVAAHAGVSKSVVSRVLQDSSRVSPASREAVLSAIDELGYRPNSLARSLTQRRTNIVGVLLHDLRQPWFADVMDGVSGGLTSTGLLPFIADGRLDRQLDHRVLGSFIDLRLDGLILAGTIPEAPDLLDAVGRIPSVVLGGRDITHEWVDVVAQDDLAGSTAAMDHLGGLGHRRIHHVAGALGRGFALRREGYETWMRAHRLARQMRVHAAVRDAGLSVPEQVSVMGYDGTTLGAAAHIRLSTVDTHVEQMGRVAAQRLVARIADPRRPAEHTLLVPQVLPRDTTAPPPAH
jgi:DNA-binding LacI/PurR family transcriptional regulator